MNWFGEPETQYSHDGGKTWRTDGVHIGPNVLIRVIYEGKVLFSGRAVGTEIVCETCQGSGKVTRHRYVQDK